MSVPHVRCTVESMNYSACGHMPGDSFELDADGIRIPGGPGGEGFCYFAIAAVVQLITEKQGADDAAEWLASRPVVMCPDPPEGLRLRVEAATAGDGEE